MRKTTKELYPVLLKEIDDMLLIFRHLKIFTIHFFPDNLLVILLLPLKKVPINLHSIIKQIIESNIKTEKKLCQLHLSLSYSKKTFHFHFLQK